MWTSEAKRQTRQKREGSNNQKEEAKEATLKGRKKTICKIITIYEATESGRAEEHLQKKYTLRSTHKKSDTTILTWYQSHKPLQFTCRQAERTVGLSGIIIHINFSYCLAVYASCCVAVWHRLMATATAHIYANFPLPCPPCLRSWHRSEEKKNACTHDGSHWQEEVNENGMRIVMSFICRRHGYRQTDSLLNKAHE